jgi:Concanavalin A-like lectin/glucanases superfamily
LLERVFREKAGRCYDTDVLRALVLGVAGVASASACGGAGTVTTYADTVSADHPISYWRFGDDPAATAAKDETGVATGAFTAGVTRGVPGAIAGDANTALAFDGTAGSVVGPDVDAFTGTAPFSVEAWIAPEPGGLPIQRICNHRFGTPHTGWRLFVDETKHVAFERWSGDAVLGAVTAPVALGSWSHVVATYDGATLSLYVNGALATTAADTHPIAPFGAPLVWAASSTDVIDFYSGRLDEGAVYDHALSADRVARHHAVGAGH